jgi:hypothetical protein
VQCRVKDKRESERVWRRCREKGRDKKSGREILLVAHLLFFRFFDFCDFHHAVHTHLKLDGNE